MMCSRPDRPGPPTHMSHRMPTAIGAWSSFSRDRDVALTRLPLCSLMNRQLPTYATKFTHNFRRNVFNLIIFRNRRFISREKPSAGPRDSFRVRGIHSGTSLP